MPDSFKMKNGVLKKYHGADSRVVIPNSVTKIGDTAFENCESLTSVTIPDSVTSIGDGAFSGCTSLTSVAIPDSVTTIEEFAFYDCTSLTSVAIPDSVTSIGVGAFRYCTSLTSVTIPDGVTVIRDAFSDCTSLTSVTIPDSVTEIWVGAFENCTSLTSVTIPDGVTVIRENAFRNCESLTSVTIPDSVTSIGGKAFSGCTSLTSVTIPDSVTSIGDGAFSGCTSLTSVTIPDSVTSIGDGAFSGCTSLTSVTIPKSVTEIANNTFAGLYGFTVICEEGSYAQQYCLDRNLPFIFDYQYEAYHGFLPPGFEKLASPFLADEEKPYIFISYSHKDRDTVLDVIKKLYEAGWRIWYDEGLTIGDRYDETLEEHVKNCSAFLLFATKNSLGSVYCRENEIPWAVEFGKPIIKCVLDEGIDYEIEESAVATTVLSSDIEPALETVTELTKGERREAKGISVIVNPADRGEKAGDDFAYCLYTAGSASTAQSILLEARNSGCEIYDAIKEGENDQKQQNAATLIVFLDKDYLSDGNLTRVLINAFRARRDIAVCQIEDIEDDDLTEELLELHMMQWLNFVHGINADMITKLVRHLQKRGCRNTAVLPGFESEITDDGIVLKRYTGLDPNPRIESEYGGIPIVKIADSAFKNCVHLKTISLPDGVTAIGKAAFEGCTSLTSITIPDSVTSIGGFAFENCTSLSSVAIPDSVSLMRGAVFENCTSLSSVTISGSLELIDFCTFKNCTSLSSVTIPDSVKFIQVSVFEGCTSLVSVTIPDSVKYIEYNAFRDCTSLTSITIPDSVTKIGEGAFKNCTSLNSVTIPDSVKDLDPDTFEGCTNLSSVTIHENINSRIEKVREEWVRKHVEKDMDSWQSRNTAPDFNDNPMALDRYEEAYEREADRSAEFWRERFDQEYRKDDTLFE